MLRAWDTSLYGGSEGAHYARLLLCRLRAFMYRLDAQRCLPPAAPVARPAFELPPATGLQLTAADAQQLAAGFLRAAAERATAEKVARTDGLVPGDNGELVPKEVLPTFPAVDWLSQTACVPVGGFADFAADNLPDGRTILQLRQVAAQFVNHGLPWLPAEGFLSLNPAWAGAAHQPEKRAAHFKALKELKPTSGRLLASSSAYWLVPCTLDLPTSHRGYLHVGDVFAHVALLTRLIEQYSLRTATFYEVQLISYLLGNERPAQGWCLRPYVVSLQRDLLAEVQQHTDRDTLSRIYRFKPGETCGYYEDDAPVLKRGRADAGHAEGAAVEAEPPDVGLSRRQQKRLKTSQAQSQAPAASAAPSAAKPAPGNSGNQPGALAPGQRPNHPQQLCLWHFPSHGLVCSRGNSCKWAHIDPDKYPAEAELFRKAWRSTSKPRPKLSADKLKALLAKEN